MEMQRVPRTEMPQMVRCEDEMKKQDVADTMMEMKAALCSLKVMSEQISEKVCVSREIDIIRQVLLLIFDQTVSSCSSRFQYRIFQQITNNQNSINSPHVDAIKFIEQLFEVFSAFKNSRIPFLPQKRSHQIMNRINRLIEKQLDKPRSYEQLRHNPFPYLQDSSRVQIFQFVHNIEAENHALKTKISLKYPDKSLEQIIQSHQRIQLKRQLVQLHKQSIQRMEIELAAKRQEWQQLQSRNKALSNQVIQLQQETGKAQAKLIEVQQQKRDLELQGKLNKQRQNSVDASSIFKALYRDVKDILQSSL